MQIGYMSVFVILYFIAHANEEISRSSRNCINIFAFTGFASLLWLNFVTKPLLQKFSKVDKGSSERRDPSHLLTEIMRGVLNREFSEIEEASQLNFFCYECLIVRP
jgi:hypothetical protein